MGIARKAREDGRERPFARAPPILVSAQSAMMAAFRKERPGLGGHPNRAADRRIVTHRSTVSCTS